MSMEMDITEEKWAVLFSVKSESLQHLMEMKHVFSSKYSDVGMTTDVMPNKQSTISVVTSFKIFKYLKGRVV